MDPLQALQAAYQVPADSKEQADILSKLRENLENHPNFIPVLCSSLVRTLVGAHDSLIKQWTLDLLHFGLGRANLAVENRTALANQSLDVLAALLQDPNPDIVKTVIQCFGAEYPLLFRYLCTNRAQKSVWETLSDCKRKILEVFWSTSATGGIKLASLKFVQRVILVQTRGVTDPRLQKPGDPNLSLIPADHPFLSASQLEAEGQKLMEGVVTVLYTMPNPDVMCAVVNSWAPLAKQRPQLANIIIQALASWTPSAIQHLPALTIRSVEKSVRILLMHFSRNQQIHSQYAHVLNEALAQQAIRMEQAVVNERNRKAAVAAEASRKRSISALSDEANDAKRLKTDPDSAATVASVLTNFDFSSLPATLVSDLIVANLQVLTEQRLAASIASYKAANGMDIAGTASTPLPKPNTPPLEHPVVKVEPVDPLAMDMGDEEVEYEPDRISDEITRRQSLSDPAEVVDIDEALKFVEFKLPSPREFSNSDAGNIQKSSMSRIWDSSKDLVVSADMTAGSLQESRSQDLPMLLLVRMVTRIMPKKFDEEENVKEESMEVDGPPEERLRHVLFDYILTNFPARERLALAWMNEEWFNDRLRRTEDPDWRPNYLIWTQNLISAYEPMIDAKDRTLSHFILNLPLVPEETFQLLKNLCLEPDRMQVGYTTLREFVIQKQLLRERAMQILLDLTTHPEKVTRGAAIITVKRWVPDMQPMSDMIRTFAQRLLRRLQKRTEQVNGEGRITNTNEANTEEHVNGDTDISEEDGEMPQEEPIRTEYLSEQVTLPAEKAEVLQHVELAFALCVKIPELLDEIFDAYGQMDESVQKAIQDLITALIRSLGPSHPKLMSLMRSFPPLAESLALRVLTIFTENGRPSAPLVTLVKSLMLEREALDARFLIPIIAEMDKPDIIRHLPRIVSMLNGTPDNKQLVRSVFESIVTTPPQTFGSVTSNLPRVRQSELLTPAELMVLLHESEKEMGLKSTIEAIGICFSMTDVFRSEILAVVMQQIVDEPVLPVLFLRTVIQAVTTYKSLVGFVSTTLLSRLITKKIWTNPPLWEGFIRCAKTIAPASFGALLQLPKDQLRDLVDRQPGLKAGMRDYVLKKGGNRARQAGFLELFGEEESPGSTPQPQTPQPLPTSSGA